MSFLDQLILVNFFALRKRYELLLKMREKLTENRSFVYEFKFLAIDFVLYFRLLVFRRLGGHGIAVAAIKGVDLRLYFFVDGRVWFLDPDDLFEFETFFAVLLFDHLEIPVDFLQFFLLFRILRVVPDGVVTGLRPLWLLRGLIGAMIQTKDPLEILQKFWFLLFVI